MAVLISLVILIALFASVQNQILQPRLVLRKLTNEVEDTMIRDAGLAILRLQVADSLLAREDGEDQPLPADGSAHDLMVLGTPVSFTMQAAAGLVDLNSASQPVLEAMFGELWLSFSERAARGAFTSVPEGLAALGISEVSPTQLRSLTIQSGRTAPSMEYMPDSLGRVPDLATLASPFARVRTILVFDTR